MDFTLLRAFLNVFIFKQDFQFSFLVHYLMVFRSSNSELIFILLNLCKLTLH